MTKENIRFTDVWFDLYTGEQTIDDEGSQRIIILTKESFKVRTSIESVRISVENEAELIRQLKLAVKNSNNKLDFMNS